MAIGVSIAAGFWQFAIAVMSKEMGWFAPVFFTRMFMVCILVPVVAIRREQPWVGLNRKLGVAIVVVAALETLSLAGLHSRLANRNCLDCCCRFYCLPTYSNSWRNCPVQRAPRGSPVCRTLHCHGGVAGAHPATIGAHLDSQEDKLNGTQRIVSASSPAAEVESAGPLD